MTAYAHFFMGDNGEALNWASKVLRKEPNMPAALRAAAMANALAGNIDEARQLVVRLRQIVPAGRLINWRELLRRPEDVERTAKAMRLAGLPK
jgi:Flp pilus assembly protein TadD